MRVLLVALALLAYIELSVQQNFCDPNLCRHGGSHIACNGLTSPSPNCGPGVREVSMDQTNRNFIVNMHNQLRSRIASGNLSPYFPASRMATMQWDDTLAHIAATNARRCVFGHDSCRNTAVFLYAGQNIAWKGWSGTSFDDTELMSTFINSWFDEYRDANINVIESFPSNWNGPAIGHFTQIVADRSTHIGCSMVIYQDGGWTNALFVCNYAITNIVGQPVYVAGFPCTHCTTGCNSQFPGLCNVGENISPLP